MRWENKALYNCILFSNTSAKTNQSWLMYVEVTASQIRVVFSHIVQLMNFMTSLTIVFPVVLQLQPMIAKIY